MLFIFATILFVGMLAIVVVTKSSGVNCSDPKEGIEAMVHQYKMLVMTDSNPELRERILTVLSEVLDEEQLESLKRLKPFTKKVTGRMRNWGLMISSYVLEVCFWINAAFNRVICWCRRNPGGATLLILGVVIALFLTWKCLFDLTIKWTLVLAAIVIDILLIIAIAIISKREGV